MGPVLWYERIHLLQSPWYVRQGESQQGKKTGRQQENDWAGVGMPLKRDSPQLKEWLKVRLETH